MTWKGCHHLSTVKPATANVECKKDVGTLDICIVSRDGMLASSARGMTNDAGNLPDPQGKRRYTWPWFLLAAVLLAIVLAVLWMSKEVERTRRIRDLNAPPPRTDHSAASFVPPGQASVWRL
jgi:hypothetical protein